MFNKRKREIFKKTLSWLLSIVMVLSLIIVMPLPVRALSSLELYVDGTNGNDDNDGTIMNPLKTLPKAITEASTTNETIIYLKEGDYITTSTITHQNLTITAYSDGAGSYDQVTIYPDYDYPGDAPLGLWTGEWIFNIPSLTTKLGFTLNHVTLSGDNVLTTETVEDGYTVTGVYIYSADGVGSMLTMTNCTLENMAFGIDQKYSDYITVTVDNSEILATHPVRMDYGARLNVYNSSLTTTTTESSTSVINLNGGNIYVDIVGNHIIGNQGKGRGIYEDVHSGIISGNSFIDLEIALELDDIVNLTISDNYVETSRHGFNLETCYSAATIGVTGNTLVNKGTTKNGNVGLYLYSYSGTTSGIYTVTNNEIVNFDYGFHYYGNNTNDVMNISFGGDGLGNIFRGNSINLNFEDLRTDSKIDMRGTDWGTVNSEEIIKRIYITDIYPASDAPTSSETIEDVFIFDDSFLTNAPTNVYVDDDFTEGNTGGYTYGKNAFSTIQEALPYVATGGTVYVSDGNYTGTIWLERSVNLIGADSNVILLPVEDSDYYNKIIRVTGEHITIDNFILTGGQFGVYFEESPFTLKNFSSHIKTFSILNCKFNNQALHAINSMSYPGIIHPGEIKIQNNSFFIDESSNGNMPVYVKSSAEQLTFSENQLHGAYNYGIELYSYGDITAEGNHITIDKNYNLTALSTSSSGNLLVQDNVIECLEYDVDFETVGLRVSMITSPPPSNVPAQKEAYRNTITGFKYGISLYGEEPDELFNVIIGGSDSNANDFSGNEKGLVSFLNNYSLEPTNATYNIWGVEDSALDSYILANYSYYAKVDYRPVASIAPKLNSLILSSGILTPGFSHSIYDYAATVNYETTSIQLTPSAPTGTILVNDAVVDSNTSIEIPLIVGQNTATIKVESGALSSLYTLSITRESAPPVNSDESSGGSSYTQPIIIVTTEEIKDSTINKTEISATTTSGIASASISSAIVDALIYKAISTAGTFKSDVIEVAVNTPDDVNKLTVSIPQNDLDKITTRTDSSFAITSPFISIIFDDKALDTISRADSGGTVVISAGLVDRSTLSEADRGKVQDRPVYDLTVMNGDKTVSDFNGGHATVSIPYTLKPGENANSVVVYYLADDGSLKTVRGHYNANAKAVVFKTTHFSKFVIGHNPVSFSDVAASAWYKNAIEFIAARGITSGTGDNQFSPNAKLTRGQFVVLLMKAYQISPNLRPTDHTENFNDAGNTYYTDYLAAAKSLGIANGVGNNMFAPEKEITRQEMFVLLYKALKVIDELRTSNIDKQLHSFNDANQVASWANEAVSTLVKAGIVGGSNNNLNPTSSTTRAEIAQVLYNLLSK